MHGAHTVVGPEDCTEEATAKVELHGIGLDGEMLRLAGEIAKDDEYGVRWRDVFGLADDDENILIVTIDGEILTRVDRRVAVMELDEFAVPVEERVGVGIF